MNRKDVAEILSRRLDILELVGNPYPCQDKTLRLEVDDRIIGNTHEAAGFTQREYFSTKCCSEFEKTSGYLAEYWMCEWSGVTNPAKEKAEKLAEEIRQEKEVENRAYDSIYGPPKAYRYKNYRNFEASNQATIDEVDAMIDWPWKYHSKDNDEAICWPDSSTYYLNLVVVGPPGRGKSHLACALYFEIGHTTFDGVEFIRAETLIRKLKDKVISESAFFSRYGDGVADKQKNKLDRGCELLILDDVGVDKSEYARKILIELIDRRNAAGLSTVITTNLTKSELVNMFGERGASRVFYRCLVVSLNGEDYRAKQPSSNS